MRRRRLLSAGTVPLLVCTTVATALAGPPAAAADLGLPGRTLLAQTRLTQTLLTGSSTVEVDTGRTPLAPGLVLERRSTLDAAGPVRSQLLRLSAGSSTRPELLSRSLSAPATPTDLATTANAVAAVNGDFFDIDRTGTPDGPVVVAGTAVKADATSQTAVGVDGTSAGWVGRIGQVLLQGTATVGGRDRPLAALGTRSIPADALALFTPAWGTGDRASTAPGGVELEVRAGRVSAVRAPGALPVPADGFVLVATGSVAADLRATPVGTAASTTYSVRQDALAPGSDGFALGARLELVRDGRRAPVDTADPTWAALRARTAIGWTATGDLLLLTVDGGTARSRGVTAVETADRMVEAGAVGAVMLDGGGSAQLVARTPGDATVSVVGEPSDGAARPVANAVGLVPAAGNGRATAIVLRPGESRVFPGLRRTVQALGTDSSGAPTTLGAPTWTTGGGVVAEAAGTRAVVRGTTPGVATLTAREGAASGTLGLEVLDPLTRLEVAGSPWLPAPGVPTDVTVTGRDARGRAATVEAADLTVTADPAVLRSEALPDGRLRLTALTAEAGTTALGLSAAGVQATLGVSVGLQDTTVDALADPARWSVATTRATASLLPVAAPDLPGAAGALQLDYDFRGQPPGTTVASVLPTGTLPLPAGTREVSLQVRGDGGGGWLRGILRVDGADRPVTFAPRVDWTGWRRLTVPVPEGARQVSLGRIYLAQTDTGARAAGRLDLAQLSARVAPVAAPGRSGPRDRALGAVADPARSAAVLSGTHVRAGDPGSVAAFEVVVQAAVAAGTPQLLLAGDVVGPVGGRGTSADVDAVRAVLARSVPAPVRWTWLPGDGEVGTPAAAGLDSTGGSATHRRLDVAGVRYLLLDSAGGSLRAADFDQLPWLRDELAAAARAPGLTGVVVLSPRGPGTGADDLADPDETALLRAWTAALAATGTPVAVVAGSSATRVARTEDVLEVDLPGAGSWTAVGAAAGAPGEWRVQVHGAAPAVTRLTRTVRPAR